MTVESNNYWTLRTRKIRSDWIAANGPCRNCESWIDLEVDHVDPTTKDPSLKIRTNLWSWSVERREAELAKCQVLCHNCHAAKTLAEWRERKEECINGHKMTPENTWSPPSHPNRRRCIQCKNAQRWGKKGRYGQNA